jgi:hypothetical protein
VTWINHISSNNICNIPSIFSTVVVAPAQNYGKVLLFLWLRWEIQVRYFVDQTDFH